MKKIISIILSVLMLTGMLASYPVSAAEATTITPDTSWYNDTDSEFVITTAAQLLGIASVVNSESKWFRGKTIKLGADIVFNEGDAADWETNPPVNSMAMIAHYLGTFDGQGHTISGLYRKGTGNDQGLLFGTLEADGKVKDLAIVNSYYYVAGGNNGGIVGLVDYTNGVQFKNVYVDVIMRGTGNAVEAVGGFVGFNNSRTSYSGNITFENCVFAGDINMNSSYVGGFIGIPFKNVTTFKNCLNLGSISVTGSQISGFAGRVSLSTCNFEKCVNLGRLYASKGYVGGIIGLIEYATSVTMTDCYVATDVMNSTDHEAVGDPSNASKHSISCTKILTTDVKGEAAKTVMTALDWENTWSTTKNGLPMLKAFAKLHGELTEGKLVPDTSWYNSTDSEFTITTAEQLLGIASVVESEGSWFRNKTIKLGADIVFNEGDAADWETNPPVNSMAMIAHYLGTFDGQGHTISGLYRKGTGATQGLLFGTLEADGIVKDLAIVNSYYHVEGDSNGGIVGKVEYSNGAQFKNVYVDVIMRGTGDNIGGFVGFNAGSNATYSNSITFENCVFAGDINMSSNYVGGFIGLPFKNVTTFRNCLNLGSISVTGSQISGFAGRVSSSTCNFEKCVNLGRLYASKGYVGGIIGLIEYATSVTMTDCYVATDVMNSTDREAVGDPSNASKHSISCTKILTTDVKGEAAKTVMTALDWENTWSTTENGLPMLKVFAVIHDELTEPENPEFIGVQTKAGTTANTVDVRFTGLIGDYKDYESIGFKFTYNGKEATVNCLKVYNGLVADGFTVNPEYYDGKYFYCYSIRGLQKNEIYTFTVSCFAKLKGSDTEYSEEETITLCYDDNDGLVCMTYSIPTIDFGGEKYAIENNPGYMISVSDTTVDDFTGYMSDLENHGYTLYQSNVKLDNSFATFYSDDAMVHVYFTDYNDTMKIIMESKEYLYNTASTDIEQITTPSLTQLTMNYDLVNGIGGMNYIITLADSTFIIIDGGNAYESDYHTATNLLNKMKELNKRPDGKIIINAWIITHAHADHYQAFEMFSKKYANEVTLEQVIINVPSAKYAAGISTYDPFNNDGKDIETIMKRFSNDVELFIPHTGQDFYIKDVKFETLYTYEDFYPNGLVDFNNSCLVLRMTIAGNTVMWGADTYIAGCDIMNSMWGTYLKSDIVQMPHHGYNNAGGEQWYKNVGAKVALCARDWENINLNASQRDTVWGWLNNAGTTEIIVADPSDVTLEFPYIN